MRLFIALDFNSLADYFRSIQDNLDKKGIKMVDSFHLTMRFIGETDEEKCKRIQDKLKGLRIRPFLVRLNRIGTFPGLNSKRDIRIIWIDVIPREQIESIKKEIDKLLIKEFGPDFGSFKPHITIARVKSMDNKDNLIKGIKAIPIESKEIALSGVKLIESRLTCKGPVYEELGEYC